MSTQYPDIFARLAAPFGPNEVRQRKGHGGAMLSYITARVAMNRLDNVLGPENWRDEYTETKDGLKCRLWLRLPNGEWTWKEDGGGFADMPAEDDTEKSAFSDAFKRACVKAGIARYLYRDGVPDYREPGADDKPEPSPGPRPGPSQEHPDRTTGPDRPPPGYGSGHGGPPRSGKALYAWTREQEQRHDVALLKYLNNWAKLQEFPGRMVDWDAEQVQRAHAEAVRKLRAIRPADADAGIEEALAN